MKGKYMSYILFIILIISLPLSFSACSRNKTIVNIDRTKLTLDDFLYDIYLIEEERKIWNSKYKEVLSIDYWEYEYEGRTMKQLSKDTIMTKVVMYELLSKEAHKEDYALSKDELADIEADADMLLAAMSEQELTETGLNRDIIIKTYKKLALGDKFYSDIISDYNVNEELIKSTIDSNEYREYITECLYVATVELSEQKLVPYELKELNYANDMILEAKRLIDNGEDFNTVLEQLNGISHYVRSFILKDNSAEEEYKESAKKLNIGEYSDIITTQFGHYIIHMIDNNSPSRYEKAVEDAILNEKTASFDIYYYDLLEKYDITINTEYWDSLDLGSITSKGN